MRIMSIFESVEFLNEGLLDFKLNKLLKEYEDARNNNFKDKNDFNNFLKSIQTECINYLKSYIKTQEFRSRYKDKLKYINIVPENYGDPYSIEICEWQDGLPDDFTDKLYNRLEKNEITNEEYNKLCYEFNRYYTELLKEGEKFIKNKYKNELNKYGIIIHTGDGDEGNIYIVLASKYNKDEWLNK